jgi:hypothetical protein
MKARTVVAAVNTNSRQVSAAFRPSSGRLVIHEGAAVIETIKAPDSWIALAALNSASGWGTRPTESDLLDFLTRYIAIHPRFKT